MKRILTSVAMAGLMALAACGGQGDDSLGDNAADRADAQADNMEAVADNMSNDAAADTLEDQADALRDRGEAREEAIDESDVNAAALTPQQKDAATNVQ